MVLMCPHCGWQYDPARIRLLCPDESPSVLVPDHVEFWLEGVAFGCPGSRQHPRNPEADRRPLWKDGGVS